MRVHFIKFPPKINKYCIVEKLKALTYLYSAAHANDLVVEQSTSSPCNAKFTGQNSQNSPRPNWNFEGVTQRPLRDAALPVKVVITCGLSSNWSITWCYVCQVLLGLLGWKQSNVVALIPYFPLWVQSTNRMPVIMFLHIPIFHTTDVIVVVFWSHKKDRITVMNWICSKGEGNEINVVC